MQGRWHPARTLNLVIDLRSGPGFVGVMDLEKRSLQSLVQRPDLAISTLSELHFYLSALTSSICASQEPIAHQSATKPIQIPLSISTFLPRKWL